MPGVTQIHFSVEEFRKRLMAMPDPELLRYGQAAKYIASPQANYGKPLAVYIVQLAGTLPRVAQAKSKIATKRLDITCPRMILRKYNGSLRPWCPN